MQFDQAIKRLPKLGGLELFAFICFIIATTAILVASNSYLQSVTTRIEASGFDAARRDTGYVRDQLNAMLERIAALGQNALLVEHSYQSKLPNFVAQLDGLQKQVAIAGPEFLQVAATDSTGKVLWSTLPMPKSVVDLSDRDYFNELKSGNVDKYVSLPLVGKISGKPTIQFAYALRDTSETFRGVMFIAINSNITRKLQKFIPDDHKSIVTIVRSDKKILSRSLEPDAPTPELTGASAAAMVIRVIREGSSAFQVSSPVDGISRFFAASHIPEWNLILLVGLETQPEVVQIAQARREVTFATLLGCLTCAAVAVATVGLIRRNQTALRVKELGRDLAMRESVLLQLAENTTDMIALMDAQFRYIHLNSAYQRMFGGAAEAWIGQRMGFIRDPQHIINNALTKLARDGGSQRVLWDVLDANNTPRWLDLEVVTVDLRADDFVSPCRYFAVARDVTTRELAFRQVASSQQRIEDILRVGPGFFYGLHINRDGKSRVELPVDADERLLGYSLQEATGDGFLLQQTHPDDTEKRKQTVQRCIADGWAMVEFRVFAKDDTMHWMQCQMQLSNRDETGTEIISFVTDITAEHMMRSRLRHSEQLATLGQLSANIAHETNQPLATISLAAENAIRLLTQNPASPERIKGKLEQIRAQVMRLSKVMDRVRQFSRNEQGVVSAFTVSSLFDEALALAAARIKRAGVTVACSLPDNLPSLRTERLLLEQVLMNLIVNACDAYDDQAAGDRKAACPLTILAKVTDSGITISVADRAGGIPGAVLPRLFEPFVTTKTSNLGTGLGLSICAATLAELGADISAINFNGGAMFEIHLPAALFA